MKVLVYPHYNNPYQDQLYGELAKIGNYKFSYFDEEFINKHQYIGYLLTPSVLLWYRVKGYKIFHLHWQNFKVNTPIIALQPYLSFLYAYLFLVSLKLLRYRLIWTVHNVIPHEQQTANDPAISRLLCKIADSLLLNSRGTLNQLKSLNCKINNYHIIPIGNYNSFYKNIKNKIEARKILGIKNDKFTFLYLGYIRKYKGIETLLQSFEELMAKYKNVQLIIAGNCMDESLKNEIEHKTNKFPNNILSNIRYISDDDIQIFFKACDIAVYPFNKLTTSSSVLLALSFKKPIIYPKIGNLKELPENIGFPYHLNDSDGLTIAMKQALNSKVLRNLGENGYKYTLTLDWVIIASEINKIYQSHNKL